MIEIYKMIKTIKNIKLLSFLCIILTVGILPLQVAIAQSQEQVNIEVSKGTLIRFSKEVNNVFIADPTIADIQIKSPTLAYVFGRRQGQTTLFAISETDEVVYESEISVNHNLGNFEAALKTIMPDTRINVEVYEGLLILTGHVKNPSQAEEARRMAAEFIGSESTIINKLDIETPVQVNLRVRIAEIGRETMKQMGFNWESALSTNGGAILGVAQGKDFFNLIPDPINPGGVIKNITTEGKNLFGSLPLGNLDLNFLVDALEEEGVISVLAEPNLTTLSGETANFLAGGEYPVPVFQQQGFAIQYKQYGVSLNFTPVVLDSGRINIHLKPEVSQLTSSGAITVEGLNIPALSTRKVETTVELGSGQSFAVAGLIQNNGVHNLTKFPWLADIPVLGALFRSSEFTRQESELVVIVTPYIVSPNDDDTMQLPTDNFRYPSDKERYLEGKSYVGTPASIPQPIQGTNGQRIKGATGFILE